MPRRKSDSVGTFAVLNIIFGCLMILCGVQGLDKSDKVTINDQDVTQQWMDFMNQEVPGYSICRMAIPILGLVVAVGFVVSGIGLQMRKNWGRISALVVGSLAIAYEAFQAIYQIAFVNPGIKKFLAVGPINFGGLFTSFATMIVMMGAVIIGGYSIILIVGMISPVTIRALREGEIEEEEDEDDYEDYPRRRRARRDYDEDEDEDEEDLPPRRPKRRLRREEEDEEDEAPPRPKRSVRRDEIQEDTPRPKPRRAPHPEDEE